MMISTLMTKSNNVIIVGLLAIIVTILLTTILQQTTIMAQSTEDSVNDVSLRVVFQFFEGEEEVNTFKVYKQLRGYSSTNPTFELAGIVDGGHPLLNSETHVHHHQREHPTEARNFDVAVYLSDGSFTNVQFLYTHCDITDYYLKTGEDPNVRVWNGQAKFPHVEHYVFECSVIHPFHQVDEPRTSEKTSTTESTIVGEKEIPTWKDFYK